LLPFVLPGVSNCCCQCKRHFHYPLDVLLGKAVALPDGSVARVTTLQDDSLGGGG
jgi:hypothetical protein